MWFDLRIRIPPLHPFTRYLITVVNGSVHYWRGQGSSFKTTSTDDIQLEDTRSNVPNLLYDCFGLQSRVNINGGYAEIESDVGDYPMFVGLIVRPPASVHSSSFFSLGIGVLRPCPIGFHGPCHLFPQQVIVLHIASGCRCYTVFFFFPWFALTNSNLQSHWFLGYLILRPKRLPIL